MCIRQFGGIKPPVFTHSEESESSFPRSTHEEKGGRMNSNRMFSLNEVSTEFAVEELEPRLEMQMLGIGADPGIIQGGGGTVIIIISSPTAVTII
jgi:hypothetical protein